MDDCFYMQMAIAEAKLAFELDEIPIGSVIVKDNKVIAKGHNMREIWLDATAHAEIVAIRRACETLQSWRLTGCTLYVTVEPCPMCAGALFMSRMDRLVYGCLDSKAGAAESLFNIVDNPRLNHRMMVTSGVLEDECRQLMQDFFRNKRKQK